MTSLALATLFFLGIHLFIAGTSIRDRITATVGELAYLGGFSVASAIGITWMCIAYTNAPIIDLWSVPPGSRLLSLPLTLVAALLTVAGFTTPNPGATGGEALLEGDDPCKGILRVSRHPAMWGIAIWAGTHIVVNGEVASIIFFFGLLSLAISGTRAIDRRRVRKWGATWEKFASMTSGVPFLAILQGRTHFAVSEIGSWRIVAGIVVWGIFVATHGKLFGVSPLPA